MRRNKLLPTLPIALLGRCHLGVAENELTALVLPVPCPACPSWLWTRLSTAMTWLAARHAVATPKRPALPCLSRHPAPCNIRAQRQARQY